MHLVHHERWTLLLLAFFPSYRCTRPTALCTPLVYDSFQRTFGFCNPFLLYRNLFRPSKPLAAYKVTSCFLSVDTALFTTAKENMLLAIQQHFLLQYSYCFRFVENWAIRFPQCFQLSKPLHKACIRYMWSVSSGYDLIEMHQSFPHIMKSTKVKFSVCEGGK